MNRDVSIVIPTFNRADFLIECIDSCINQTVHCEIIVCDHGSTDNTPQVVKKYGERIKYVRRELDSGVHFCWMDGILHASNDLIHLNFDDDWIEPTFIEKCAALFNKEVGCVFSNAKVYFENSQSYKTNLFDIHLNTGIHKNKPLLDFNLTSTSLTSPGAGVFRKQVLIDNLFVGNIPFTNNHYHGVGPDSLFTLMSCTKYPKFGWVNEDLAIFRAHDQSITINASKDQEKTKKIASAYLDAKYFYKLTVFLRHTRLGELLAKFIKI